MNREDVAQYLDATYASLIAVAFPSATYAPDVTFSYVIDAALRAQGVAEGDLPSYVTDDTNATQDGDTLALADYFALRQIWRQVGVRVATAVGPLKKDYQQQFANVAALLEDARKEITQRGYGQNALQLGRIQLDIFEPLESGSIQYNPWWGS